MARVAAVHDSLGHVDAGARYIGIGIDVRYAKYGAAVDPHAHLKLRSGFERRGYFQSALNRGQRVAQEHERHAVARGQTHDIAGGFSGAKARRFAHNALKLRQVILLAVHRQEGITHDVGKQHVSDFECARRLLLPRIRPLGTRPRIRSRFSARQGHIVLRV